MQPSASLTHEHPSESAYGQLSMPVLFLFIAAAGLGALSANPLLTAASILAIPLFVALLWRPGEPPILLFAVGYQWAQVTGELWHANVLGVHITERVTTLHIESATWLALVGLVVLASGMRVGLHFLRTLSKTSLWAQLESLSVGRVFVFFLITAVGARLMREFAWSVPGLTQQLLALNAIRWAAFFLLAYMVFKNRRGWFFFAIAFAIEFIGGIGFFSGFKTVIFVTIIAAFSVYDRIDVRTILIGAAGVAVLLVIGSAWTVVKSDYRSAITEGQTRQGATVSRAEQVSTLYTLVAELNRNDLADGMDPLFRRIAYTQFFSYTMEWVPAIRDHEGGQLWLATLRHVFQPRVFFPDKPRLPSDSELTMQYTGLTLATDRQATSISIGYMGESYIDFGRWGMFVPIFLIGVLWGLMYWWFVSRSKIPILGLSIAMAVLLGAHQFEMTGIKLIGGVLTSFIVFALLQRFAEPLLWRLLVKPEASPQVGWVGREEPRIMPPTGATT